MGKIEPRPGRSQGRKREERLTTVYTSQRRPSNTPSKSPGRGIPVNGAKVALADSTLFKREWVCQVCGVMSKHRTTCDKCKTKILNDRAPKNQGVKITDELRFEVRRRLSKFESPTSIASALGITTKQVKTCGQNKPA